MELRAERGRAVLVGAPELFEPSTALAGALDEWAEVAAAVSANGQTDPVTVALVSARGRQLAAQLADAAGTTVRYTDLVHGVLERAPAATPPQGHGATAPPAAEPTPWATGLTVSAFAAAVTVAAVVTLVRALGEVTWPLGALALVVITAGLAPSIWMARNTPSWRWLSYGVGGGLALSWVAVALSTLGP